MIHGAAISTAADHACRAAGVLVTMAVKKQAWRSLLEYAANELEQAVHVLRGIQTP